MVLSSMGEVLISIAKLLLDLFQSQYGYQATDNIKNKIHGIGTAIQWQGILQHFYDESKGNTADKNRPNFCCRFADLVIQADAKTPAPKQGGVANLVITPDLTITHKVGRHKG